MEDLFKGFEDVTIDLPWVHNTVNITKDHFSKAEVLDNIRTAFYSLKCNELDCDKDAYSFNSDTKELRCNSHTPIALDREEFEKMEEAWHQLSKKLLSIEKNILTSECIYSFAMCDVINNTTEKPSRDKAKNLRDRIFDICKSIEMKSAKLGECKNSLHVFDFLFSASDDLKKLSKELHSFLGMHIAYYYSKTMMDNLMKYQSGTIRGGVRECDNQVRVNCYDLTQLCYFDKTFT